VGRSRISSLLADLNNPHVLGLDANEAFFLTDRVILLEGQEDVMFFPKVLSDLDVRTGGHFYGWGVGGADKLGTIAQILNDLGFAKVAAILDANKAHLISDLQNEFPEYLFVSQPADDVRFRKERADRTSLLAENSTSVRNEYRAATVKMLEKINLYFSDSEPEVGAAANWEPVAEESTR
jgi:hypothetical protein